MSWVRGGDAIAISIHGLDGGEGWEANTVDTVVIERAGACGSALHGPLQR